MMKLHKINQEKQLVDNLILSKNKSSSSLITAKITDTKEFDFMRHQKGTQIKNPLLGGQERNVGIPTDMDIVPCPGQPKGGKANNISYIDTKEQKREELKVQVEKKTELFGVRAQFKRGPEKISKNFQPILKQQQCKTPRRM